jgi:phytoene dehydrogenase-like protein
MNNFDFIIVGGGHNGLTCAAYLAKAGESVIVLERRDLVGGGVMTEEITLPGFKHNTHSTMHEWIHAGPVYKDLELKKYGSNYIFPDTALANIFSDGSSLIYYSELDRFCREIERFSKKDAKTFRELYYLWSTIAPITVGFMFSPPIPLSAMFSPLEGLREGRELIKTMFSSTNDVLDYYFDSEEVKTTLAIMITQLGTPIDDIGTGLFFPAMMTVRSISEGREGILGLAIGGSKTLADAMVRVIGENKGIVRNNSEVKEIIIRDKRAVGVRTADGREIFAKKGVICNVGPALVFGNEGMVHRDFLDERFLREVDRWRPGKIALFTPHFALNDPPVWKAAEKNPKIKDCWVVTLCDSREVLINQMADIRVGKPPKDLAFMTVMPTVLDPTQAPEGKHTAFLWQYAPYDLKDGGAEKWDEIKEDYADKCLEFWQKYAPNMDKNNIIARKVCAPIDITRRNPSMIGGDFSGGSLDLDQSGIFRPFLDTPPYRTPVEDLYMCGPSSHPGGGCSGAPGYNSANIIAEDFKIKKWWKPFIPDKS